MLNFSFQDVDNGYEIVCHSDMLCSSLPAVCCLSQMLLCRLESVWTVPSLDDDGSVVFPIGAYFTSVASAQRFYNLVNLRPQTIFGSSAGLYVSPWQLPCNAILWSVWELWASDRHVLQLCTAAPCSCSICYGLMAQTAQLNTPISAIDSVCYMSLGARQQKIVSMVAVPAGLLPHLSQLACLGYEISECSAYCSACEAHGHPGFSHWRG